MKLSKIDIENFRSFRKLQISDFQDLNLIVGNNNLGKTSILEAIFLSIGFSNPRLVLEVDRLRGLIHDESVDFRFIFHNMDYNQEIRINSEFGREDQFRKLIVNPISEKIEIIEDKNIKKEIIATSDSHQESKISGIKFDFSIKEDDNTEYRSDVSQLEKTTTGHKITGPNQYKEKIPGVFLRPTSSAAELHDRLDKILINKELDRFIKPLKNIDNRISNISLGSKNMVYFDIGLDKLVPIQIMGDGIIRLLSILTAIAFAEHGIVLIDEIENGFYYGGLHKVWASIYEAAKYYNVQVFATTHSKECIQSFSKICSGTLIKEDSLRLFRIEKKPNDFFKVIKYDQELLSTSIESDWEVR